MRTGLNSSKQAGDERLAHFHWESWLLRALLAITIGVQVWRGFGDGARVAAIGLVISFLPLVIGHFSHRHVPRLLENIFVFAMALQFISESFKLFEILTYWDKIVHPGEIFLASGIATVLLLGYREKHHLDIPDGLSAAGAMLFGMALGSFWEMVEFSADWFGNANLQKSNADTITDLLTNNAGAIFGTLLAFWLYRHRTTEAQRRQFGDIAEWLTGRAADLFERHGRLVGIVVALIVAGILLAGWWVDRGPIPPPPSQTGQPAHWAFAPGQPPNDVQAILGTWQPDQRGLCQVNREHVWPGSEKMGLLALEPGRSFEPDPGFVLSTRYFLERPRLGEGTAMEAGLVFGLRGPDDFYLLHASATHDTLRLERYLHGRRRDVREERLRTRGNEWHQLSALVRGDSVTAMIDGREVFAESGLAELPGELGLWARVTTAGCFQDAQVVPPTAQPGDRASRAG